MAKKGARSVYTPLQWKWIGDRYLEGYDKMEIARFLQMHYSTVWIKLNAMGIARQEIPRVPLTERVDEFNRLRDLEG